MSFLRKPRKGSLVKQVTVWYSLFIFLILLAVLSVSFYLFLTFSESNNQHQLETSANQMRQYVMANGVTLGLNRNDGYDRDDDDDDDRDNDETPDTIDDGIYYAIYDANNQASTSSFPAGFDQTLARSDNQIQEVTLNGRTYQFLDLPLGQNQGWLRAVRVKQVLSQELVEMLIVMGIGLPLVMVVVIVGGYWILKRGLRPIQAMTETAKTITEKGDYSNRIVTQGRGNELTDLAQVLNTMLSSIETSFEREKQFSNDISHELRTPITVILSESEFGKTYADSMEDAKDSFAVIQRQSQLMKKTVEQLLELARAENQKGLALEDVNLTRFVQEELADQERLLTEKGIQLKVTLDPDLHVAGQSLLLKRLLDNLLTNAAKFTKDEISVSLKGQDQEVHLTIADNGKGIAVDQQDKIWQRFYQVDTARNKANDAGVGLGLSLVKQIADLHGATIELQSEEGQGAKFTVIFPKKDTL